MAIKNKEKKRKKRIKRKKKRKKNLATASDTYIKKRVRDREREKKKAQFRMTRFISIYLYDPELWPSPVRAGRVLCRRKVAGIFSFLCLFVFI